MMLIITCILFEIRIISDKLGAATPSRSRSTIVAGSLGINDTHTKHLLEMKVTNSTISDFVALNTD